MVVMGALWLLFGALTIGTSATAATSNSASPARWSAVFRGSPDVLSPATLAPLLNPKESPFRRIVDIRSDAQGNLWLASLDGGAARYTPQTGSFQPIRARDGLPSNRAIVVATHEGNTWIGTSMGLAQYTDGTITRTWSDTLPDPYVQTLAHDTMGLWIGTYKGLALWSEEQTKTIVSPWSVFFLGKGTDQRMWVGYEGLRGLPDLEPIEGIPESLEVYSLLPLQRGGTLLATLEQGIVRLHEGEAEVIWAATPTDGAYALAATDTHLWAAAGAHGLVQMNTKGDYVGRFSKSEGLPSQHVNALHSLGDTLWIGTEFGLAKINAKDSISAIPVSLAAWSWDEVYRAGRHVVLEGAAGTYKVTRRGLKPISSTRHTKTPDPWYAEKTVLHHRHKDGRIEQFLQVNQPLDWAEDEKIVWVGTTTGLEVLQPESGLVVDALGSQDLGVGVVAVSADGRGGCWLGTNTGQVVYTHVDGPEIEVFDLPQDPAPTITGILSHRKRGAWVTTDRGLFVVRR